MRHQRIRCQLLQSLAVGEAQAEGETWEGATLESGQVSLEGCDPGPEFDANAAECILGPRTNFGTEYDIVY